MWVLGTALVQAWGGCGLKHNAKWIGIWCGRSFIGKIIVEIHSGVSVFIPALVCVYFRHTSSGFGL